MIDIGKLIGAMRRDRRMSQEELGEKIGCSKQTISNYERNVRRPDIETLELISSVLEVPVTVFVSTEERNKELDKIYNGSNQTGGKICPYSISDRLRFLMHERNLSQTDIVNLCSPYFWLFETKLRCSDVSKYLGGKVEPTENKMKLLACGLNVSDMWLYGFTVPMERDFSRVGFASNTRIVEFAEAFANAETSVQMNVLHLLGLSDENTCDFDDAISSAIDQTIAEK